MPLTDSVPPQENITPTVSVSPPPSVLATATPTANVIVPPRITQTTVIDDTSQGSGINQFNYLGKGWGHQAGACGGNPCPYNSSNSWDNTINDYVTIAFNGTQIKFYGVVGPPHGIGAFSIDGGSETMVDFYSPTEAGDTLLYTSPMLPSGQHTLQVRVTGNQSSQATWNGINPDRVDILS